MRHYWGSHRQTSRLPSLVLTLICVGQVHHPVPHQRPVDGVDARDVTGAGMGVDEGQISGERLLCFCNDGLKGCPLAPPLLMKMRDADHGRSPTSPSPRTHVRRSGRFCGKFQSSTTAFQYFFFGIFQTDEPPAWQLYISTLTH